jgi:hypothetical protein
MKRIILIVTIALLPILSACFFGRVRIKPGQAPNLVLDVNKRTGTLTNLKDDKGRRLFKKSIEEGFYVSYRVGCCKEKHVLYAIGNRVSYPKMSYSGYQEKINGAGVTSKNGLNVTSGWGVLDKSDWTIESIRTIVNLSRETIYLSEVKDYFDTNLLPKSTRIGPIQVAPLPRGTDEVAPLPRVTDMAIGPSPTYDPTIATENCWPCKTWPKCILDNVLPDPTRATVICIDCDKNTAGLVHVVCLVDLKQEQDEYSEEEICEHQLTLVGIDARPDRPVNDVSCPPLIQERTLATSKEWSERDVEEALSLKPGSAVAIITKYKINLPTK